MEALWKKLDRGETAVAVVGLGYVGLPLALHLGRSFKTIGYDIDDQRIRALRTGNDETGVATPEALRASQIHFTSEPQDMAQASLFVVAVPTPIDQARVPDLNPLIQASRAIGTRLGRGNVVVYESTVYPGVTEEVCGPVLEATSGLKAGRDFFLGYSPERINPGDGNHTFANIVKVVSGQTPEVLELLAQVYGRVVTAGIHRAPDIRTAEAAKVIENTQRDLNIALMNELAVLFHTLGIDTRAVLDAAATKWNFLRFEPGLVGGHCIGVDPYYLTYLANKVGHAPKVILAGRQVNDGMGKYVAEQTIKQMIKAGIQVSGSRVLVLGLTFKEDVPDLRNAKVFDVIRELREYDVDVLLHDPVVSEETLNATHGEAMTALRPDLAVDGIVLAVKHRAYLEMGFDTIREFAREGAVFIDVKGCFDPSTCRGLRYWRL